MLYFAQWKILLILGLCALGVLFSVPNLFTPAQLAWLPQSVPHRQVALGLDLRGGSYLLLEVDIAQNVRVRVLRSTITSVLAKPDPGAAREAAAGRPAGRRRAAKEAAKDKEPAANEDDKA